MKFSCKSMNEGVNLTHAQVKLRFVMFEYIPGTNSTSNIGIIVLLRTICAVFTISIACYSSLVTFRFRPHVLLHIADCLSSG